MLTNLLHYEFKSTGRVVLPIVAGVLVLNIFTNILSHFVQNTSDRLPLAGVAMALLALASAVSLLVVLAICFFIEIQQFYRLLGERGCWLCPCPFGSTLLLRSSAARYGRCSAWYFLHFAAC